MTVYEQLGAEGGIRTAVDEFYRRVVADPQLAPFFDGVDLPRLRAHQAQLLVQVTGGPARYDGRDLATAHARLGIGERDFDRVVEHLVAVLVDAGVGEDTIAAVGAALGAHRQDVVTAPVPAP
ncbi:group 1 truncated hemoglobin [Kineococcus glutinatus]|uniref:Group 1 truncated hemoglobin n=1 Tax=Kineococcus glutinatus TaxID=1070872 RepID=A0ABP9HKR3_9ACTN